MADYALSRASRLEKAGFAPVLPWQIRSNVAVSEQGVSYRVPIGAGYRSAVFQVDGNIIKTGIKCDKFLVVTTSEGNCVAEGVATFIELKGKDISHAVDQLEATVKNPIFLPFPMTADKTRARIVTVGCGPKSSSRIKLEEARVRFKRLYNVELRVLKNSQPDMPLP